MRRKIHIKKGAILSASLVGAMLFGLSAVASASIETHSRGIFEYLHGERKVVLDATDFDTVKGLIEATDNDTESVAKAIEDGKDLNRPFTSEDLKSVGIAGYAPDGVNNEIIITANDFDALADRFSPYTTFGKEDYTIKSKGTLGYDDPTTDSELEPEILIEGADFSRIDDYMKAQTRHTTFRVDGISDRTNDTVPAEIVLDTLASWDTPGQYVFTAPETGSYKLMGYGAQGGNAAGGKGGLGGYTEGVVSLEKGQKLYVTVGGQGKTGTGTENLTDLDGYNGGGSPWPTSKAAGGGGMTTFSTAPSLADSYYTIDAVQKTYDVPLTYNYTGGVQSVTLPKGKYQIEVYGAQGGGTNGGKGGYEKGTYEVTSANETLYLYVGGQGTASSALGAGGGTYGGGHGGVNGYGGGGMTYVSKSESDNLQALVSVNSWSESGLIAWNDDGGNGLSAKLNSSWKNNRGYDEYVSLYAGRYAASYNGVTKVTYALTTPSNSKSSSRIIAPVDSGTWAAQTYDPDALVATILVKNGETLTYSAYAYSSDENSESTFRDPTLFLVVGSGSTSGTNYTADKSGMFNASSVLLAAGGGGGAGNTTTNARGGAGAGYEEAGRPYINGTQVGVKTKMPATQANNGGCGQGGGPDGGRFVGCGESATYTTNTGGAGGGYYGGYVTNSTNGGAGGGAGYVNTSVIKDASSGVGVNSGNGRIVITEIPKNTYVAHQTWSNSDKVLMAAAGGGGASISVGQGGKGGDGGGYVSGVGQSGTINTADAGAGGGGYTGGTIVADKKPGNGGQNYTDGVNLGKSKSGKRKGNGYAGIIYLSSSEEGVIDVSINDESNQEIITAHPGTQLTFPEVRKKGYTLIGWYATEGETATFNEGVQVFEPEAVKAYQPIVNYTYWARWEGNHFNVIFDKNDVEDSNSPVLGSMETQRFEYDEAKALTTNAYTRRGYKFLGWSTDKNRTPEEFKVSVKRAASDEDPIDDVVDFTDGSTIKNLSDKIEDITIYAVWEPIEYNISYDLNKGSSSTVPVEYKDIETGLAVNPVKYNVESYKDGSELKIMSPSMPGYTFKGWTWTYTNGDDANYQTTEPVIEPVFKNIIGDIRFTANWEANKYTVHFINNLPSASLHRLANIGGVNANNAIANNTADECYQVFTFDADPVALSLDGTTTYPKAEVGYTFLGWSSTPTEKEAAGNVYSDGNISVYNNGTFRNLNNTTPLSEATEHLINLQRVKNLAFGTDTTGTQTVNIYGCWGAKTYNITYDLADHTKGFGSTDAKNPNTVLAYTIGSEIALKDATRPGYAFDGWTAEFTGEIDDVNTFANSHPSWLTTPTKESMGAITLSDNVGDVTFTAHWSPNAYTIEFNKNQPGGTASEVTGTMDKVVYTFDADPVALPENKYLRNGYNFLGWSTDATLSDTVAEASNRPSPAPTRYSASSKRVAENIVPADLITANDKTPLKNLSYGTNTKGTTKVTLYAIWDAIEYNLTYDLNDISDTQTPVNPSENNIGTYTVEDYFVPKDPTMLGYTFLGWTGSNGDTPSPFSIQRGTTGDKAYEAQWRANNYTVRYDYNDSTEEGELPDDQTGKFDEVVTFGENSLTKEDAIVHHTKVAAINFDANGGVSDLDRTETSVDYDMGTRYEANGWTYPLYNGGTNHGTSAKNMTSVDGDTVVLKPYWNLIVDSVEPALTCYTTNTGKFGGVQITASKDPLHTKDTFNSIYNGRYYQYRDKITTYTFTGWYTSRTGGSKVTSFSAPSGSGDDNKTTYYAHYTEAVSYDYNVYPSSGIVIYEPAGGSYGTWNGNIKGPKNLTGASVTGTASESDAGSYTAKYTPNSGYCWSDGTTNQRSVSWSIDRAKLSYPSYSGTYNGSYQGPGEITYTTSSGTTEAKNAGSYTAYYTPDDNHCWNNGTYSRYTCSWSISKKSVTVPTDSASNLNSTYGTTKTFKAAPTGSSISSKTFKKAGGTSSSSYSSNTTNNAGEYVVTYALNDKTNYQWSDSTTTNKKLTYTVDKADQSITVSPSSKTIDVGETFGISVSGAKTSKSITYSSNASTKASVTTSGTVTGKAAGSANITVTAPADDNYNAATKTVSVIVEKPAEEILYMTKALKRWDFRTKDGSTWVTQYDYLFSNDMGVYEKKNGTFSPMPKPGTETYNIYHRINGYEQWNYRGCQRVHTNSSGQLDGISVQRFYGASVYQECGGYDGSDSYGDYRRMHAYKSGDTYYFVCGSSEIVRTRSQDPFISSTQEQDQRMETTSFGKSNFKL